MRVVMKPLVKRSSDSLIIVWRVMLVRYAVSSAAPGSSPLISRKATSMKELLAASCSTG
jgi:hypothetical protein